MLAYNGILYSTALYSHINYISSTWFQQFEYKSLTVFGHKYIMIYKIINYWGLKI